MDPVKLQKRRIRLAKLKELQAARERLRKLKSELLWRKRNFSISYYAVRYDPATKVWTHRGAHKQQEKFHRSKKSIRVASGGNRSGKSTAGINEDVAHALGYRPWLKPEDPDYKVDVRVPNKGLICGEAFQEQVKKVIIPKLLGDYESGVPGAIPTEEVAETKKNPQGVETYIRLKNGSEMFMQSYDQKVDLFESADYDWIHFDEPPPRSIWVAAQRGLTDRNAPCWLTMTPLKEPWLYDDVYNREDCEVFYFDIEDNLGYGLSREGIDKFSLSLTEDEKEARLRGRYFHLTGLVYKVYGPVHKVARHKVFPNGIPNHWPVWLHIDCHPKKPHHTVWLTVDPMQRKFVIGELLNASMTNRIPPFCEAMRVYQSTVLKYPHDRIEKLIDPLSGTPNPVGEGLTIWDEFDDNGFTCRPGSKNREAAILLFQNELRYDPEEKLWPNIYFCDDLKGIDFEMTHYIWEDHANKKVAERKDEMQVPRKKHDDFIEGIHRILLEGPVHESGDYDESPEAVTAGRNPFTGY